MEAFEYECIVDYLVKPITEDRFQKSNLKKKGISNKCFKTKRQSLGR
jgi:response regulator of citrate/malate metabolism